jgi:NAD(P)-dependent dehydrogenase (short-subunit alcohol dehydrogenase family)
MGDISHQRVILVTGASTGIGRLCAERLAASGWRVFGAARSAGTIESAPGSNLDWLPMDVTDDVSVQTAIDTILAQTGRIDAIVNNAGFSMRGSVEDVPMEEARAVFETNFFGALRVCRAAAPALRARGGYIVNMSSLAGVVGLPFTGHYCATKFALEGLSECLRYEMRPYGVHVVLVEPGDYRTGIQANRRTSSETQQGAYAQAFDRFLQKRQAFAARAPTAEPVAALVERILNDPAPRLRYVVAMPGQKLLPLLRRLLPQGVYEACFRRLLSL